MVAFKDEFPEIENMTDTQLFIEGARLTIGKDFLRLRIRKFIYKGQRDSFYRDIKNKYKADEVEFVSIQK